MARGRIKRIVTTENAAGGDTSEPQLVEFNAGNPDIPAIDASAIIDGTGSDGGGDNGASGSDDSGGGSRTRRKYTKRSGTSKTQTSLDLSGAAPILFSIHAMLAAATKCPELGINEMESKNLAEAAGKVMRHYDVQTTQKTLDWINLAMVVGACYGPRVFAIGQRQKNERINNPQTITQPAQPQPNGRPVQVNPREPRPMMPSDYGPSPDDTLQ